MGFIFIKSVLEPAFAQEHFSMKYIAINIFLVVFLFIVSLSYFMGVRPLIVTSNSMSPAIKRGDLILIIKDELYSVGDVVSYVKEKGVVTHRVFKIKINKKKVTLETKGDANLMSDNSLVKNEQVLGKVKVVVPVVGFLLLYLQSKYGIYLMLLLIVVMLFKKVNDEK